MNVKPVMRLLRFFPLERRKVPIWPQSLNIQGLTFVQGCTVSWGSIPVLFMIHVGISGFGRALALLFKKSKHWELRCLSLSLSLSGCICVCTCMCIWICICICIYACTCIYAYVYVYAYENVMYVYVYVYICICTCLIMSNYVYVCVYVHIHTSFCRWHERFGTLNSPLISFRILEPSVSTPKAW